MVKDNKLERCIQKIKMKNEDLDIKDRVNPFAICRASIKSHGGKNGF